MSFPVGWPPRAPSGRRSIRFYQTGTATASFSDKAYLFVDGVGANPYTPLPYVPPGGANVTVDVGITPTGTGQDPHDGNLANGAASAPPKAAIWSYAIRICHDGSDPDVLEYSFDGDNVHGSLLAGESVIYWERSEAGIAVRGANVPFRIEAW